MRNWSAWLRMVAERWLRIRAKSTSAVICTVESRHVMGIIEDQRERIKCHAPGELVRRGKIGQNKQRQSPGAAAENQVGPRIVEPKTGMARGALF